MKPLERSTTPVPPYRLPSQHPSADGGTHPMPRDSAPLLGDSAPMPRDNPVAPAPKVTAPVLTTASDIKRRQEALLIAYLVNRLAR
jgi:hypothetical protein